MNTNSKRSEATETARPERRKRLFPARLASVTGLLLMAAWAFSGSAVPGQQSDAPSAEVRLGPGAVAIVTDDTPAAFSFERSQGRIESASEGAASAARAILNTPELGHPWINAGAGVVEFVFAPIAAGYGALGSARARLPQDKLAETEGELVETMKALAGQEHLHELLMQATNEIGRPLVALQGNPAESPDHDAFCARLEARVEQLRLERADRRDRFALRITARARLVRTVDGGLIYERAYEYRSGKAMFVDWARHGGFEGVARTGYREMAGWIAKDVATRSTEAPMLLGAGYSGSNAQRAKSRVPLAPEPGDQQQIAFVSFRKNQEADFAAALPARLDQPRPPVLQAIQLNEYQAETPSFEIESSGKTGFLLQLPESKAEAVLEARSDTEWALDGLENDRNFVIQAGAALAAVPLGLWEQSSALWRGVSRRRLAAAKACLAAVTNYARPQKALALEVARSLTPQGRQQILPAMGIAPARLGPGAALGRGASGTFVASVTATEASDTVLEIRVLRASLSGEEGMNPRLALNIAARASVVRIADGAELYSVWVFYRSREQRFCAWAAHEARAFRQELDCCYRQMGRAMASELVSRGLVPPSRTSVFARN